MRPEAGPLLLTGCFVKGGVCAVLHCLTTCISLHAQICLSSTWSFVGTIEAEARNANDMGLPI